MNDQVSVHRRLSPEAAEGMRLDIDRQVESLVKSFGISQAAQMWLAGTDLPDSKNSKPTRPYSQVALVYTCVNKIINAIAGLPLVLSNINEQIVESGPAYDLLFNNPSLSWEKFVTATVGHYSLSRDVFWIFPDLEGTNPKDILVVSGTQMHPITHDRSAGGVLLGWEFRGIGGQRKTFTLDEVYQWKNFNPYDRFSGLGPVTASQLNINYSFAADLYNSSALANGAEPGVILTAQGQLDEDQVRMLRSQFDARHKGAGQAKRTAVLTGGMDAKTVALKMTDMQVAKITEMSDKKICSAFGVPPGVVGLITEAQYSHGPAIRDFIFNTIIPLASLFAGELTAGILSRFSGSKFLGNSFPAIEVKDATFYSGRRNRALSKNKYFRSARHRAVTVQNKVFAWFDANQHPVVQEANREKAEKVLKYTEAGIPLNDIIEVNDLLYDPVPWGNDWWIGMGQVPARYALEAGIEGITGPSLPEGETPGEEEEPEKTIVSARSVVKADDEQQRLRIWQNWVISWAGIEREYTEAMRKFFIRQQRILLSKLRKALGESKSTKADPGEVIARVVFDLKLEDEKVRVINRVFFEKASELGIRQGVSETIGLAGDKLDDVVAQAKRMPLIRASLVRSSHKITKINRTTQNIVARQLEAGIEAGEGLSELSARIARKLGGNRNRAWSIARTQTAGAMGTGRHTGFKAVGIDLKSWLSARDDNVRDSHREAEARYIAGIALDVPFQVGGEFLMYPGDPAGSAGLIANCRCVEIAMRAAGKTYGLAYYSNLQFYSYNDMQKAKKEK